MRIELPTETLILIYNHSRRLFNQFDKLGFEDISFELEVRNENEVVEDDGFLHYQKGHWHLSTFYTQEINELPQDLKDEFKTNAEEFFKRYGGLYECVEEKYIISPN